MLKNNDLAKYYFEKAAVQNDPKCQFYSALLNMYAPDDFQSYLAKSIQQSYPDAMAFQGKLYLDYGDLEQAFAWVSPAIHKGSFLGLLVFANMCEQNPVYGDSAFYYQLVSERCHCSSGFSCANPIPFKKYKCEQCEITICEACAYTCHKGHSYHLDENNDGFNCECGSLGLFEKCNTQVLGTQRCEQCLYQCLTCSPNNDHDLICRNCSIECHQGHNVICRGLISNSRCHCRCENSLPEIAHLNNYVPTECSIKTNGKNESVNQRSFHCFTCQIMQSSNISICHHCAINCHQGHFVLDLGN